MFNSTKNKLREKIIRLGTRIVLNGIEEYFYKIQSLKML